MIVRNPAQRVAVLVDVQNMYYSAKNLYKARLSFKNLLKIAVQGRILTRAIAYVIESEINKSEKEFFPDGTWRHKKIILSPDNKDFKDIILEDIPAVEFRVVAELVTIL